MNVSRTHLFTHPEQEVSKPDQETFLSMIRRRQDGEPVAYITGQKEFWSLMLEVSPAVLIPRPETEILVEAALDRIPPGAACRVADIGTGSGAIALAIAYERPDCEVHASDISQASLEIAKKNARRHDLERVQFHHGSWLEPLNGSFELIASNPPYVAPGDPHLGKGDLRYEPEGALVSGPDGLDAIRTISEAARDYLHPGGWLILEHGHDQGPDCLQILNSGGYHSVETFRDLEGTNRLVAGRLG